MEIGRSRPNQEDEVQRAPKAEHFAWPQFFETHELSFVILEASGPRPPGLGEIFQSPPLLYLFALSSSWDQQVLPPAMGVVEEKGEEGDWFKQTSLAPPSQVCLQ